MEKKKEKLDVLVTFYNQEKYVDRAFNSIFSQQCNFNFNVLVGDDGSNDNTLIKIKEWINRFPGRIFVYTMPREQDKKYIGGFRASQNRLNLLKHVKAEYYIFLDGDDYFSDIDKFQSQIDILDNPDNQDCIGCAHQISAAYPDGTKSIYYKLDIKEGKYSVKRYWYDLYFHTDTAIVRSCVIRLIPFDLLENNFNDNLITYIVMQAGKIYYLPEVMAIYDQTGDGIWTGEKTIINNIRNMFLYDFALIINRKLKKQSNCRFANTWKSLFKIRKLINSKELEPLLKEAEDKNLSYSIRWIKYNESGILNRIYLFIVYIAVCFDRILFQIVKKSIKLFKKIYHVVKGLIHIIVDDPFQMSWHYGHQNRCCHINTYGYDKLREICSKHNNELHVGIAPVYRNKSGIVTIISDDGDYETSKRLNELSKESRIPITVAGAIKNIAPYIGHWKNILKEGNLELVNHSYNHYRMDEQWKYSQSRGKLVHEIVHPYIFLRNKLGVRDKVFICPENQICNMGYNILKDNGIIAVRRGIRGYNELAIREGKEAGNWYNLKCCGIMDAPDPLSSRKAMRKTWLEEASQGKWLIEMWHNVDAKGYQSISKQEAREHLADICHYRDRKNLWCAKFTDAVKYLWEKQNCKIYSWVEEKEIFIVLLLNPKIGIQNLHELTVNIDCKAIQESKNMWKDCLAETIEVSVFPNTLYSLHMK